MNTFFLVVVFSVGVGEPTVTTDSGTRLTGIDSTGSSLSLKTSALRQPMVEVEPLSLSEAGTEDSDSEGVVESTDFMELLVCGKGWNLTKRING